MKSAKAIAQEWFERTLESYPAQTAQFVRGEQDQFRNPVGSTFQPALVILAEEVLGKMDVARIFPALDGIVRIRAVQDFTAAEAVGFVFLLKDVLAPEAGPQFDKNVDKLALLAFDNYMRCRDQMLVIRGRNAWRCPTGASEDSCGS